MVFPRSSARERDDSERPQEPTPGSLPVAYGGSYRPLSDEEVETVLQAALTVLEEVGIEVASSASRRVWR
jgi:trimethylamine:corrinoid methyltransferase-like protein